MTEKPRIIVLSADGDKAFNWLSDGWHTIENRHTAKAKSLMETAHKAIDSGIDVPDAIKRLEAAGFEVVREINLLGILATIEGNQNTHGETK